MTDWHLQVKANVGEHRHLQVRVKPGADLGEELKPSSWYLLLKLFCLPHRLVTSFLRGAPPPKKNPGSTPDIDWSDG